MNPHTATLAECCDWLAVAIEQRRLDSLGSSVTHEDYYRDVPPLKPTLDTIAAAMPEGWSIKVVSHRSNCQATGWPSKLDRLPSVHSPYNTHVKFVEADTELLARARLAVACHMAEEKTR